MVRPGVFWVETTEKVGASMTIVRCARYSRKSTEHGLEQKFNSLEAQREACEAYIISQKSKGWTMVPEIYEDGGFTGANMERPGLQKLLDEIKAGKIDVVVVYKHDRLTRSLMDFARLIEVFDEHDVSFVSVTEQFNTTDSSGRLFLNMLFSFAQYEREIAAERTRDKIAASKRRGLWMGGTLPMGYDAVDKELVVNAYEAKIIRFVFGRYIECNSAVRVAAEAKELGYRTKERKTKSGIVGGKLIDKNTIYRILHNKTYLGKVAHKGQIFEGKHKAIISQETWDTVHSMIKGSPRKKAINMRKKSPALLAGVLKCGGCNSGMTPTHTKKKDKQYNYYKGNNLMKKRCSDCPIGAIPAGEVENLVLDEMKIIFKNPAIITKVWSNVKEYSSEYSEKMVWDSMNNINALWEELFPLEKRKIVQSLISSIVVYPKVMEITIMAKGIKGLANDFFELGAQPEEQGLSEDYEYKREVALHGGNIIIRLPVKFRKQYKGHKSIIFYPDAETEAALGSNLYDEALVKAIVRAFKWWDKINDNSAVSIDEISKVEKINHGYISKIIRLTCLSPDIIFAILNGEQPKSLMLSDLMKQEIPDSWQEQRQLLGFNK